MTNLEAIQSVVDKWLEGETLVHMQDRSDDICCAKILWGDCAGLVGWFDDEPARRSEHWHDALKLKTWLVVDEMLRRKERDTKEQNLD
jgi:hypothetical protein